LFIMTPPPPLATTVKERPQPQDFANHQFYYCTIL